MFSIQNKISERVVLFALLSSLFILFFLISFFSEATFDMGDGLRHYMISRYSWKHPWLFFDSWGKPFFTLISSPFSQFGLLGTNVFNILCAMFSACLCFLIAKKLNLRYPLMVVFLLCFSSIYFPTMNSGLTEPFFSFVLILSVYFMFAEKYFLSSIIVSFLPYVRSEGYLILPLFFILLLYRKKIFFIPWLAFGTIAYTLAGYFYYHDILWIKNHNPYSGSNRDIYGHGEIFHFVKQYANIFGKPLTLFLLFGITFLFYKLFFLKSQFQTDEERFLPEEIFLVYGSLIVCFVAHSIFWWQGIVNSLGLIRVMAGVMPVAALVGLRGLNWLIVLFQPFLKKTQYISILAWIMVLYFVISTPFKQYYFPYKLEAEQKVIKQVAEWIKTSEYKNQKIYFLQQFLGHALTLDVFDPEKSCELWSLYPAIKEWGIGTVPDKSIVVWDAHYGPNEARIPLDQILNDTNFRLLKIFKPEVDFTVLGGYKFAVYLFSREKPLPSKEPLIEFYDFEDARGMENKYKLTDEKAFAGKNSSKLSAKDEYGFEIEKNLKYFSELNGISIQAKIFSSEDINNVFFVMQIDDSSGKMLSWAKHEINITRCNENEWKDIRADFIPSAELVKDGNSLKIYLWNPGHKTLFTDYFTIKFKQ